MKHRAKTANNTDEKYVIFSDSQKALQLISSNKESNSIKASIVKSWLALRQTGTTVCFSMVKAHSGVRGNEVADRAAKNGLKATTSLSCRFENNDTKEGAEDYFLKQWQIS